MFVLVANDKSDLKKLRPHFANGFVSVKHTSDSWHKHNGRCSLERSIRHHLQNSLNVSRLCVPIAVNELVCLYFMFGWTYLTINGVVFLAVNLFTGIVLSVILVLLRECGIRRKLK